MAGCAGILRPAKGSDLFAGKAIVISFRRRKDRLLERRANCLADFQAGFPGRRIPDGDRRRGLEFAARSAKARTMTHGELVALAGGPPIPDQGMVYVPRIPIDALEARGMLAMMTVFSNPHWTQWLEAGLMPATPTWS